MRIITFQRPRPLFFTILSVGSVPTLSAHSFIRRGAILRTMFKKTEKRPDPKAVPPFGGLESITDEEIDRNIEDYPYVMGKLKDC